MPFHLPCYFYITFKSNLTTSVGFNETYASPISEWHASRVLTFLMQLHKHMELSIYHFTRSILQVLHLYFPKGGITSIMSKINTWNN
jgi:hypothetical protein